jgi:hypothetical protein
VAERDVAPPEPTVAGLGGFAVTEEVWATGSTVSSVESLSPKGEGPSQVASTVRVTTMSESVRLAGAV